MIHMISWYIMMWYAMLMNNMGILWLAQTRLPGYLLIGTASSVPRMEYTPKKLIGMPLPERDISRKLQMLPKKMPFQLENKVPTSIFQGICYSFPESKDLRDKSWEANIPKNLWVAIRDNSGGVPSLHGKAPAHSAHVATLTSLGYIQNVCWSTVLLVN